MPVFDSATGDISDASLATRLAAAGLTVATASNATPLINGVAAHGSSTSFSRDDHVHPTDTGRANAWTSTAVTGQSGAGTTRTDATAIAAMNKAVVFSTVTASTGAVLPATAANDWAIVQNAGANTLALYANGSETINGAAGATGISVPAGKTVLLIVPAAGVIFANVSA